MPNSSSTRAYPIAAAHVSSYLIPAWPYRKTRKPDPMTVVKRASVAADDNDIPTVTERRCNSRPRLPVDDDEESDGAQARSRVRTGRANIETRRGGAQSELGSDRLAVISDIA